MNHNKYKRVGLTQALLKDHIFTCLRTRFVLQNQNLVAYY